MGIHAGHRVRPLLVAARLPRRRRVVRQGRRGAGRALVPGSLAAVTLAQGGDRRSSRAMWEAIRQSAENRLAAERRRAAAAAARRADHIDALQRAIDAAAPRTASCRLAGLIRAGFFAGVPVDPTGVPLEHRPRGARVTCRRRRRCSRCPTNRSTIRAGRHDRRHHPSHRRRGLRRGDRQLPQRLHLSASAAAARSSGRVGVRLVRPHARLVRKHPDRQLSRSARPLPRVPRRRSPCGIRSSSC